jgi:hypothetical protein
MSGAPNDPEFAFSYTAAHQVSSRSLSDADYLCRTRELVG